MKPDEQKLRFTIKDEHDEFRVSLIDDSQPTNLKEVGHVVVVSTRVRVNRGSMLVWETHSRLNPTYHRKGLGVAMYVEAIRYAKKHGYQITSSRFPSPMAQRVWLSKTLNKMFKINRMHFRWWVL